MRLFRNRNRKIEYRNRKIEYRNRKIENRKVEIRKIIALLSYIGRKMFPSKVKYDYIYINRGKMFLYNYIINFTHT